MTLTKIASAAVRAFNKENGTSLKKVSEVGDATIGAVIYRSDTAEYQVLFFRDSAHLPNADYFTTDKADAIGTAERFCNEANPMMHSTQHEASLEKELCKPVEQGIEVTNTAATVGKTAQVQKPRPRGYYAQPSKLFGALFNRV